MEGFLNARHWSRDIHVHAIARSSNHRQAVCLGETNHGVIIFLARTKPVGELLHRQELAVGRAGRIVEVLQKAIQRSLVAVRQNKHQADRLRCGKTPNGLRLAIAGHIAHMARQRGRRLRLAKGIHDRHKRGDRQ
jgi:hypothetical protein